MSSVVEARRSGRVLPVMLASAALLVSVVALAVALTRPPHAGCSSNKPMQCPAQVPQVVGSSVKDAQGVLRSTDLVPTVTLQSDRLEPTGVVVAQSPAAGTAAKRETTVALVVSAGP